MPKNKPGRSPRRYARVNAAAAYLDVHPVTIRKMIEDGKIHAYRCGQRLLRVDLTPSDDEATVIDGDATMLGPQFDQQAWSTEEPPDEMSERHHSWRHTWRYVGAMMGAAVIVLGLIGLIHWETHHGQTPPTPTPGKTTGPTISPGRISTAAWSTRRQTSWRVASEAENFVAGSLPDSHLFSTGPSIPSNS